MTRQDFTRTEMLQILNGDGYVLSDDIRKQAARMIEALADALPSEQSYLVWSDEHRAWWRGNRMGYTKKLNQAGRYTRRAALEICANATLRPMDSPYEVPVLVSDAQAVCDIEAEREAHSGAANDRRL